MPDHHDTSLGIRPARRRRQARRFVLDRVLLGAAVLLIIVTALTTIATFGLGLRVRTVLTGSMRPAYGPGALLVTRSEPTDDIHPGMIVLFVPPGRDAPYAHRVVTTTRTDRGMVITTKGDANPAPDPWHALLATRSVSVVVTTVPGVGRLFTGVGNPIRLTLLGVGAVLVGTAGAGWFLAEPSRRRRVPAAVPQYPPYQ